MKKQILSIFSLLLMSTLSMVSQVPSYLPQDGLIGWWPFNGNTSDFSETDSESYMSNASMSDDRFGIENSSIKFGPTTESYLLTTNLGVSDTISRCISLWFKLDEENTLYNNSVLFSWGGTYFGSHFSVKINFNPNPRIGLDTYGSEILYSDISLNQWYHLIVNYDNSNGNTVYSPKFYLDCVELEYSYDYSSSNFVTGTENPIKIGSGLNGEQFFGKIDDIALWDRSLTYEEIQKLCSDSAFPQNGTNISNDITNPNINLDIYPNPTTDVVNIDFHDLNKFEGGKVKIMSMSGQIVYEENITQSKMTLSVVDRFSKGIYIVTTTDSGGNIMSTEKLIVQ